YGIAKEGIAKREMDDESKDLSPLFETILEHVTVYPDYDEEPLQLQISALAYDDYIGRLGIGRVYKGIIEEGKTVSISKRDGSIVKGKVSKLLVYEGLKQVPVKEAKSGDIAVIAGIADISIGETLGNEDNVQPMEMLSIEEPTLSMNFLVNDSPLSGKSGKFVTTRHVKARLEKELEVNVGLKVEPLDTTDGYKVSGRGELHLSILLENMRREGYEVAVSKPEVLMHRENDKLVEPMEKVIINVPDDYAGTVIAKLNVRKGTMQGMVSENGYTKLEYLAPTRGLLGFRSEFINDTRGEGTIIRCFEKFEAHKGEIPGRLNGVLVSQSSGAAMGYALYSLSDRGTMFVHPGTEVYEGMIIGMCNRKEDIAVNPCKNKKLTNVRASGSDDAIKLSPPRVFMLEEALEFIGEDELVEITPDAIRLRKKLLNENERMRFNKKKLASS
ncbi:MAG: translational GTPase TypA, partial [Firmicutes bacterium]|nr:translational GTPase TypA [Bacillota bacterium]